MFTGTSASVPPEDGSPAWRTAIGDLEPDRVIYRGFDLAEVMQHLDFIGTVWLLFRGSPPTDAEAELFNAMFVALADHGISPSQAVTRYTAASGSPLQACVAAGVLTIGDAHGGAGEVTASLLVDYLGSTDGDGIEADARALVEDRLDAGERVPGYGHPDHPDGDPRTRLLLERARELDLDGEYTALATAVESALIEATGAELYLNINGASAALLLDLGFDPSFARPFVIMARVPGLLAHAIEEKERESPWREVAGGVEYDGPTDRHFEP